MVHHRGNALVQVDVALLLIHVLHKRAFSRQGFADLVLAESRHPQLKRDLGISMGIEPRSV